MIENILKCVTNAEEEAEEILKDAQKDAKELIKVAEEKAEQMKKETADTIKLKNQEMLKEMQSFEGEAFTNALQNMNEEAKDLRKAMLKKKQKAVEASVSLMQG